MRITSGGNVGIGTSSPNRLLSLYKTSTPILQFIDAVSGTGASNGFLIYNAGLDAYLENTSNGFMSFSNNGAERMRITSAGNVKIEKQLGIGRDSSASYPLTLQAPSSDTLFQGYSSNGSYAMDCYEDASGPFHMRNGSCDVYLPRTAGTWVGNSDKTIKENIELIPNSLNKLMQLNGYSYNLIDDKEHNLVGVIAQEVYEVLPQAVHYTYNKKYDREIYGVEYDALIPLLINAIKEQQVIITSLQEQITELKQIVATK